MAAVQERVLERLARGDPDPRLAHLIAYTVFHEDMHGEAFTYTRQTLGYPAPVLSAPRGEPATSHGGGLTGDVDIAGEPWTSVQRPRTASSSTTRSGLIP
jgi:iron(II)-dependent oxidoreductase